LMAHQLQLLAHVHASGHRVVDLVYLIFSENTLQVLLALGVVEDDRLVVFVDLGVVHHQQLGLIHALLAVGGQQPLLARLALVGVEQRTVDVAGHCAGL